MSNYVAGHAAEVRAARHLQRLGFAVLQLNWRTRWCEIDIVAQKGRNLYFVEVKYRRSDAFCSGLAAITRAKLGRMRFAADCWLARHSWQGEVQLAIMSITGSTYHFEVLEA